MGHELLPDGFELLVLLSGLMENYVRSCWRLFWLDPEPPLRAFFTRPIYLEEGGTGVFTFSSNPLSNSLLAFALYSKNTLMRSLWSSLSSTRISTKVMFIKFWICFSLSSKNWYFTDYPFSLTSFLHLWSRTSSGCKMSSILYLDWN